MSDKTCKACGACDNCESCSHCNNCKNCGKPIAPYYYPYYVYPYPYWWQTPYYMPHQIPLSNITQTGQNLQGATSGNITVTTTGTNVLSGSWGTLASGGVSTWTEKGNGDVS